MKMGLAMVIWGGILSLVGGLFFGFFTWPLIIVGIILVIFGGIRMVRK